MKLKRTYDDGSVEELEGTAEELAAFEAKRDVEPETKPEVKAQPAQEVSIDWSKLVPNHNCCGCHHCQPGGLTGYPFWFEPIFPFITYSIGNTIPTDSLLWDGQTGNTMTFTTSGNVTIDAAEIDIR